MFNRVLVLTLRLCLFVALLLPVIAVRAQPNCPLMRVSIASDGWVACDNAVAQVHVCNEGNQTANNAQLSVYVPFGFSYISSNPAPSQVAGDKLTYALGTFPSGDCRNISITLAVPCDAEIGAASCLRAEATPINCPASAPGWDGVTLNVKGYCSAPDSIHFTISNKADATMGQSPSYVIIEDHLMRATGLIPILGPFDTVSIGLPNPTGGTYTFQTSQTPGHPFPEPISISIEGCGTGLSSKGYLMQYPQYNGNVHSHTFCDTITTMLSGQHKSGFPLGYNTEHLIHPKTTLNYRIRFQNTSNATVQTVTIRDTISNWLNLNTLKLGAASHPFTFSIQNQVLSIVFSGLQLPPASVNPSASRGFVYFHINPDNTAPLGTIIENTASVQMGNLPAVFTDTTEHKLGENFITAAIYEQDEHPALGVQVIPNPMSTSAQFIFSGQLDNDPIFLQISDLAGRSVFSQYSEQGRIVLERNALSAGVYFFIGTHKSGQRVTGKLLIF